MEKCATCTESDPKCEEGKRLFSQIAQTYDAITEHSQFHLLPGEQQAAMQSAYWNAVSSWNRHIGKTQS